MLRPNKTWPGPITYSDLLGRVLVTRPTNWFVILCRHFEKTLNTVKIQRQHNTITKKLNTIPNRKKRKTKTKRFLCCHWFLENMSLLGKRGRELKLLMSCPSLSNSKIIQFITYDDKKIDLGSIARNFGLDPSTLRLNGYFISRGVDLISSSVTWNSLLSFFSSKGLSTGKDYHDALLVTAKVGNKRMFVNSSFLLFCWFYFFFKILWQLVDIVTHWNIPICVVFNNFMN